MKTENSFLKRDPTIKQNIVLAFDIKCDNNLSKLLYLYTRRRYLLEHHVLKISSPKWVVNATASKMFLEEAIFIFSWLMILKSTALWPCQLPLHNEMHAMYSQDHFYFSAHLVHNDVLVNNGGARWVFKCKNSAIMTGLLVATFNVKFCF